MKRALKRTAGPIYHMVDGHRIDAAPPGVRGDLRGVRGDLSGVWGDLSDVRGNLSGVRGDLSDVRGDLSACEITSDERKNGIDIETLIMRESAEETK